ncbi:precorrin-6A reductase [Enterococcus sp. AZ109]|uniref:precorrin-6A reductase n=1 Tax=Enterococcus sp. AZ109 TaxID=2774634 RepID=UPI003F2942B0
MILVLGGTSDSLKIAEALKQQGLDFYLSVVSDYGATLASEVAVQVVQGRMNTSELCAFIKEKQINQVIDATHPFAVEVSKNTIAACQQEECDYVRYERPSIMPEGVQRVPTIKAACQEAIQYEGKIYLTTGSKTLARFSDFLPKERLLVRVLPTAEVLQICEELGLQADQIEAVKGPFSEEMNLALLRHNQAGVMITKESGQAGGFMEKVTACRKLNIPCIVIEREKLEYPQIANTTEEVVQLALTKKE